MFVTEFPFSLLHRKYSSRSLQYYDSMQERNIRTGSMKERFQNKFIWFVLWQFLEICILFHCMFSKLLCDMFLFYSFLWIGSRFVTGTLSRLPWKLCWNWLTLWGNIKGKQRSFATRVFKFSIVSIHMWNDKDQISIIGIIYPVILMFASHAVDVNYCRFIIMGYCFRCERNNDPLYAYRVSM